MVLRGYHVKVMQVTRVDKSKSALKTVSRFMSNICLDLPDNITQ